jgi:hypothetical protein
VLREAERADLGAGQVERRLLRTAVRRRTGACGSSPAGGNGDRRKNRQQKQERFHQGLLTRSASSCLSSNCVGETSRGCGTARTAELPGVDASNVDARTAAALGIDP